MRAIRDDSSFDELSRIYVTASRMAALLPLEGRGFDFIGTRLHTIFIILCTVTVNAMYVVYNIETMVTGRPWKSDELYITILSVGLNYRSYVALWKRERFRALFSDCAQLWRLCDEKGRATVKSYERTIRILYISFACNAAMTLTLIPVSAYFVRLPALEPNCTELRVLPYAWFTEQEPYRYLGYEATLAIQVIITYMCAVCGATCEATCSVFIVLAAGYFSQLGDRLTEASCNYVHDPLLESEEIMSWVRCHQKLLNFCDNLQKYSQLMLFSQLFVSSWSMSLVLIKLAGSDARKYEHLPILIQCIYMAFMVQWLPDQLADQSEEVASAVYNVLTRNLHDKPLCRDLRIMMTRAQAPVQLMAGGFIELSLENFTSMMNGAYSFFTVLRNFDL